MVCKLAGVLVDFVIGLPDELSGSDTRALSERTLKSNIESRCEISFAFAYSIYDEPLSPSFSLQIREIERETVRRDRTCSESRNFLLLLTTVASTAFTIKREGRKTRWRERKEKKIFRYCCFCWLDCIYLSFWRKRLAKRFRQKRNVKEISKFVKRAPVTQVVCLFPFNLSLLELILNESSGIANTLACFGRTSVSRFRTHALFEEFHRDSKNVIR